MANTIAPNRGEQFVDSRGVPLPVPMRWIEEISRILNSNTSSIESRLDALEPQFVVKDATDSPYSAVDMDFILADMSAGDLTIVLPSSGRVWVSRSGSSNTLTLQGTVNGVTNPTIVSDGDAPAMAYIGTEWRYV